MKYKFQKGGTITELGYKRNSPYKNRKSLDIASNQITMEDVDVPLQLIADNGQQTIAQPNSGEYYFPGATKVKEIPMEKYKLGDKKKNSKMQSGGMEHDILSTYLDSLPEQEQDSFIDSYSKMSEDDKYTTLMKCGGTMKHKQSGGSILPESTATILPLQSQTSVDTWAAAGQARQTREAQEQAMSDASRARNKQAWLNPTPEMVIQRAAQEVQNTQNANQELYGTPYIPPIPGQEMPGKSKSKHKLYEKQSGGKIPIYPETNRNQANVETENLETVQNPDGALYQFKGATHAQGGIPTNLPGGAKVFSEHDKAPTELISAVMQKDTKKKYSFAALSKKFPTKPFLETLADPKSDEFEKNTAKIKLANNQAQLDLIFSTQEGLKKKDNQSQMQSGGEKMGDVQFDESQTNSFQTVQGTNRVRDPQTNKEYVRHPDGSYTYSPVGSMHRNSPWRRFFTQSTTDKFQNVDGINVFKDPEDGKTYMRDDDGFYESVDYYPRTVQPTPTVPNTPVPPVKSTPKVIIPKKKNPPEPPEFGGGKFGGAGAGEDWDSGPMAGESAEHYYARRYVPFHKVPDKINTLPTGLKYTQPGTPAPPVPKPILTPTTPVEPVQTPTTVQPTNVPPVTKAKNSWFPGSKLTGTLLDIGLAASDELNIDSPNYRDNRKYPLFTRFYNFDDKEVGRNYALATQEIQNSNLPEQVKQSQIASLNGKYQDYQAKTDFNNVQRYEQKLGNDTEKLQTYLNNNVDQATQDLENYRKKKANVEYLHDQFRAQQKARMVNSARSYFDYVDETNMKNQLASENYRVNPITGQVEFKGEKKDPLKEREQQMSQYIQNPKNRIDLGNGAYAIPLGNDNFIMVNKDGTARMEKGNPSQNTK